MEGSRLSVSGAPQASEGTIDRIHLLPLTRTDVELGDRSRMEFITAELRRKRDAKEVVRIGDIISHEQLDFVAISCEPSEGVFGSNTMYFIDGNPVVVLEKIQFSVWGPEEVPKDALFTDYVSPYMNSDHKPYGFSGQGRVRLFHPNKVFQIDGLYVQVEALEPMGMGVVTAETEIFTEWDSTPDFQRVHVVPFQDTIPRAYEFDAWGDYLKPFFRQNQYRKFVQDECFSFSGVQFKVVACEPEGPARVGAGTVIFCEGSLQPTLRNLLPPEMLAQVSRMPPGLQLMILSQQRSARELEETLARRRGLFEETLQAIPEFIVSAEGLEGARHGTCMICLADFAPGEHCRTLPCNHVFHVGCVDEWLRRCTDCPMCRANVDRAIRAY